MMKVLLQIAAIFLTHVAVAQDQPDPGHSHQGGAFDEGPRRFATLVDGTGPINFEVTGCSDEARLFINQAIGQLHGFLHYEAERSFRHAAYLDDSCMMAFWGMAQTNTLWVKNTERAVSFIEEARKRVTPEHTERELMYVRAIENFNNGEQGQIPYVQTLKQIYETYPEDLDAKALFVVEVWNRDLHTQVGIMGYSYEQKTLPLHQLAQEILSVNPSHPVHHYVVHMWDKASEFAPYALPSADVIGFGSPGIAHMWHMGGHTYSKANAPMEMWWSQEASARVDHKYMASKRVFPFMLHNHAHNNEWLSRTLMEIGDFNKAWKIALNLLGQPRHPVFNTVPDYQHIRTGVRRVSELIVQGEYWQRGKNLFQSPLLNCEDYHEYSKALQECQRARALTELKLDGQTEVSRIQNDSYQREITWLKQLLQGQFTRINLTRLSGLPHLQSGWGRVQLIRYAMWSGNYMDAAQFAQSLVTPSNKNFSWLLTAMHAFTRAGQTNAAQQLLPRLQKWSQEADLSTPFIASAASDLEIAGIASSSNLTQTFTSWRPTHENRPELEDLGPLLWQPWTQQNFQWVDKNGQWHDFERVTEGKTTLLVLVLNTCPHCDLQVKLLKEKEELLNNMGIELVAVTSQSENMPVYKQWDAFDDFEDIPLHGLYLVNAQREVVWQDTGAEAFVEIDFLMNELRRLKHPYALAALKGEVEKLD